MRVEPVEIYSDTSNLAVMRHPGRRFPGSLVQGDSLHILCSNAERACDAMRAGDRDGALDEISALRDSLRDRLNHYKRVLAEHDIPLPFSETPTT